ncbi:Hcp family type VI secretion system effector [Pseudomonas sp. ICMP 460]|uniref:Hcp family type VI secretion system effector n=1 Tax=Pseudomonas sp. ICMP 460 TaxID=1718917 RepID=UPI000C07F844|nr:Hcp family type VI secretion system effector [Pseudomonas sp. ICMP 460]PHN24858.1 type VI secretion system protein [Pseudomonas sp. ICMP 460]
MANHGYMSITGKKQGLISSSCSSQDSIGNKCQIGHFDEIMVLAYSHDMVGVSDGAVTSGRSQHRPVVITKNIDKSSPLIANALHDGEEVECVIDLYRASLLGGLEKYFSVHLSGARIAYMNIQVPHVINMSDGQPQEIVAIRYRDITWTHVQAGTSAHSTWNNEA